jgi:hypothetical protein
MKTISTVLLLAATALLAGCGMYSGGSIIYQPSAITSFKDPEFTGRTFRHLAVLADTNDLGWRHALEAAMVRSLRSRSLSAVESHTVIPPTRSWTEGQQREALAGKGVDAYLRLVVDTISVVETEVPLTTSTTTSRELKRKPPMTGYDSAQYEVENETVTTKSEGGYTVRTVTMRYRIALVDVVSGRTAWMALDRIDGDAQRRLGSFCEEIAAQLVRDAMVTRLEATTG